MSTAELSADISAGTRTQLPFTSIPEWARPTTDSDGNTEIPAPQCTGSSYLLVGIGPAAAAVTSAWAPALAGVPGRLIEAADADTAVDALAAALAEATVGVRVLLTGPIGACLSARATAVAAGVEDDEIQVVPVGSGPIDVFCSHCRTITTADAGLDAIVDCAGCDRGLLVYYHVSRRSGSFLGFMADAETTPAATAPPDNPSQESPA
ncbi:dimethylamine monooxygenase subunit DmmA family protein [Gordonia desulfuricans]|uniref:dimethylamine monooxygenase subunit DmmA family protein n=1 Tax=Gordonia desulfuricans TaxID=89051 RepID=UPI000A523F7A|nr:dimethylamine monooxygenase subunit DmmA family protein [Gordonia desulfuricans]